MDNASRLAALPAFPIVKKIKLNACNVEMTTS